MKRELIILMASVITLTVRGQKDNTCYYEITTSSSPAGGNAIYSITDGSSQTISLGNSLGLITVNGKIQSIRTTYIVGNCNIASETPYSGSKCTLYGYQQISCNNNSYTIHSTLVIDNPVYIDETAIVPYSGSSSSIKYSSYCSNPFNKAPGSYEYLTPRLQYQSNSGAWKDLPFTLSPSGGQITFSPRQYFEAGDLYKDIAFRVLKTVGNEITCETYGNIAGTYQFYDTATINIQNGIRLVCQDKSIGLIGGYKLFGTCDVDAYLEARMQGSATWIPLNKKMNALTELYFNDLNNNSWIGKEIEIRPYKVFQGKKIPGNIERIMFLPPPDIQASVKPPSCYGKKDGIITLTFPARSNFNNLPVPILITIVKYDLHKLSETNQFYRPCVFPGDTATYYFFDGVTFELLVNGNSLTIDSTTIADSRFTLSAGKYKITARFVNDASCSFETMISMPEPGQLKTSFTPENQWHEGNETYHIRTGLDEGTAILSVSGGTAPYRYCSSESTQYISFAGNQTIIKLPAGTHIYNVLDNHNCISQCNITLQKPKEINISVTSTGPVLCHSNTIGNHGSGFADILVSGGIPPFRVEVIKDGTPISVQRISTRGIATISSESMTSGTGYHLLVTDTTYNPLIPWSAVSGNFSIPEPPDIQAKYALTPALCSGQDAGLKIQASGGTGALTFVLNDSIPISGSIIPVEAGKRFFVKITDSNGCIKSVTGEVPPAPPPLTLQAKVSKVSCQGVANGEITVIPSGGTSFAQGKYKITFPGKEDNETLSIRTFGGLNPGSYFVLVTDSNGCSAETYVEVPLSESPLQIASVSVHPASCSAIADGSIAAFFRPGDRPFPPYQLDLERFPGLITKNQLPEADTITYTGLKTGEYELRITDNAGCSVAERFIIPVRPDSLRIGNIVTFPAKCPGTATGKITVTVEKGTQTDGMYRFWLMKEPGSTPIQEIFDSTGSFEHLEAGIYLIKASDEAGCIVSAKQPLTSLPTPVRFEAIQVKDQSCKGIMNGSMLVSASTDKNHGALEYTISPETEYIRKSDTLYVSGLIAGTYRVRAADSVGCLNDTAVTIHNLGNEPRIHIDGIDSAACLKAANGSFLLRIDQNIPSPSYKMELIHDGKTGHFDLPADNTTIGALEHGIYTILVTDIDGCTGSIHAEIPVKKDSLRIVHFSIQEASCRRSSDASLSVVAGGGIPSFAGYKFLLDGKSLKYGKEAVFPSLSPGKTYSFIAMDSAGCMVTLCPQISARTDTLKVMISETQDTRCHGSADGSLQMECRNGRSGPDGYTYTLLHEGTVVAAFHGYEKHKISNLPAGKYTVQVSDSTVCTALAEARIQEPDSVSIAVFPGYVKIKGSFATPSLISVSGGTSPYFVRLMDETGKTGKEFWNAGMASIDGLKAGYYLVKVTDTAGCGATDTMAAELLFAVHEPEQNLQALIKQVVPVSCYQYSNGQIEVMAAGGWESRYLFSIDSLNFQGEPVFENLTSGEYRVYIRDTAGVTASVPVYVPQPELLKFSIDSIVHPTCDERQDGSIALKIQGGTPPYFASAGKLLWHAKESITGLDKGNKEVWVKDSHECLAGPITAELIAPPPITLTKTNIVSPLCGRNSGNIEVEVAGGTPAYSFLWTGDNGFSGQNRKADNIAAGRYSLEVIDKHQCKAVFSFQIADSGSIMLADTIISSVSCYGYSDGTITLVATGGTPPYKVLWDNGKQGMEIRGLPAGRYTAEIADQEGCRIFASIDIPQPDSLFPALVSLIQPLCSGKDNGSIRIRASGGTPGYRYLWNTGSEGETISGLAEGRYFVTIIDSRNCIALYEYVLKNQRSLKPDLGGDLTLCKESSYWLLPGKFAQYNWYLDGRWIANNDKIEIREPGEYVVEVRDNDGCMAADSITINRSDEIFEARLLVASKAITEDTVVLIETSWPAPDSLRWYLPDIQNFAINPYIRYCLFPDTGMFEVILTGFYHGCVSADKKQIIILNPDNGMPDDKANNHMITRVKVYPNPLRDACTVEVELSTKEDVQLRILQVPEGKTMLVRQLKGSNFYSVPLMLPGLPPGMYMIQIQCREERKASMVVVE